MFREIRGAVLYHHLYYPVRRSYIETGDCSLLLFGQRHNSIHQIPDNRIIVNVSLKENELPARAQLKGQVINLLDQVITLDFVEVLESDAVYYLATHISLPEDILRFNLLVTPFHNDPVQITFMRRYD